MGCTGRLWEAVGCPSPEKSLPCWAEWQMGFILVSGAGGARAGRDCPLTVDTWLPSRRALVLSSWVLRSWVSWCACPLLA